MGLLTGGIDASFHSEAQKQKQNIAQAVYTELPNHMKHFDLKAAMVEPSFFSELLGLQGRMDYLQLDFRVLIEQKSGKGEFPYNNYVKPKQKEEHYVQLLLYMALIRYNFREIYERNKQELHAFLLYSKYTNSLLGLGFAPELIFRAMKIRNEIADRDLVRPSVRFSDPRGDHAGEDEPKGGFRSALGGLPIKANREPGGPNPPGFRVRESLLFPFHDLHRQRAFVVQIGKQDQGELRLCGEMV